MDSTSRTSKSIKNSAIALVYLGLNLVLSFFSRKIFLEYLGSEILGLNTTALNLLQFLNLAEMGINVAVGFTLYKPLREDDKATINEIIALQGHLYRRIGFMMIIGAVILMAFFPLIFNKMSLPIWYAYASFSVLLFSSLIGYFYNYKQVLLTASQLHYKITYSYNSILLGKICVQMVAIRFFLHPYIWWLIFEFVFAFLSAISLQKTTARNFPFLSKVELSFKELKNKYSEFTIKIKQLFFHKIISVIISQSSPLIIYAYTTLSMVAIYGNYMIIINGVTSIFTAVFNSIGAGIGNLVAEGNKENILKVFKELFSVRFYILVVIGFCVFYLSQPFIYLWIGLEYLLPNLTVGLMDLIMIVTFTRYSVEGFIMAYGLVQDIYSPIIEAALNLGLSILLGYYYGLNGILAGTLFSLVVIGLGWKPYFLFSRKFKGEYKMFLKILFSHFILSAICCYGCYYLLQSIPFLEIKSWGNFIVSGIFSLMLISIILGIALIVFRTGFEMFIKRMFNFK